MEFNNYFIVIIKIMTALSSLFRYLIHLFLNDYFWMYYLKNKNVGLIF
jgi:hypothetical protein